MVGNSDQRCKKLCWSQIAQLRLLAEYSLLLTKSSGSNKNSNLVAEAKDPVLIRILLVVETLWIVKAIIKPNCWEQIDIYCFSISSFYVKYRFFRVIWVFLKFIFVKVLVNSGHWKILMNFVTHRWNNLIAIITGAVLLQLQPSPFPFDSVISEGIHIWEYLIRSTATTTKTISLLHRIADQCFHYRRRYSRYCCCYYEPGAYSCLQKQVMISEENSKPSFFWGLVCNV